MEGKRKRRFLETFKCNIFFFPVWEGILCFNNVGLGQNRRSHTKFDLISAVNYEYLGTGSSILRTGLDLSFSD